MLYVTDLDGTLLRNDSTLSEFTVSTWNYLAAQGVGLTCATSRSLYHAKRLLAELTLPLPLILLDGTLIYDPLTSRVLRECSLETSLVQRLIQLGAEFSLDPFIVGEEAGKACLLFSKSRSPEQEMFLAARAGDPRLCELERLRPPEKTMVLNFLGNGKKTSVLRVEIEREFGGSVEVKHIHDSYFSDCFSVEILPAGADKSTALLWLADYLGILPSDITVFGDNLNDLGMFEAAGRAIAVGNAKPEVKMAATEVVAINEDDGVARYLVRDRRSKEKMVPNEQ